MPIRNLLACLRGSNNIGSPDATALQLLLVNFGCARSDLRLWLIVASETMLLTVMDTSALLPLFLSAHLGAPVGLAAQLASLFPFGMAVSVFFSGFAYDALEPVGRANLLAILGALSCMAYVMLATETNVYIAGALLFFAGACFSPAKYLPSTIYVLETIDPAHSGKVLALMDVPGYICSAIFFRFQSDLLLAYGWSSIFYLLALMVLTSTMCIVAQQRMSKACPRRIDSM